MADLWISQADCTNTHNWQPYALSHVLAARGSSPTKAGILTLSRCDYCFPLSKAYKVFGV